MEKFGIFNLLSALTSLSRTENAENEKRENDPPQNARQTKNDKPATGIFTAEERAGRCAEILERHERISRNIDRKNR